MDEHQPFATRPENTRTVYKKAWTRFSQWCEANGKDPLPASPETVKEFARHSVEEMEHNMSTTRGLLSAIGAMHTDSGHPNPSKTPLVKSFLQQLNSMQQLKGNPPDTHSCNNPDHTALGALALWGATQTGALTLGDLADAARKPEGPHQAWKEIAAIPLLDLAPPPRTPKEILEEWAAEGLGTRQQKVLWELIARKTTTPAELAKANGIKRMELGIAMKRTKQKLAQFLQTPRAAPVKQRASEIRSAIGVAMNSNLADTELGLGADTEPCRDLILELAGPYTEVDGWLVLEYAAATDPTGDIIDSADETGRINRKLASYRLSAWGLNPEQHTGWLTKDGRVKEVDGNLVSRGKNAQDRAAFALSQMGSPATAKEILDHLEENGSAGSLRRVMAQDARFSRTGPSNWGLSSWNLPVYLGAVHNMREVLEGRGEMDMAELFEVITGAFGIPRSTLEEYIYAPIFIKQGTRVRLRTKNDPQSQPPPEGPLSQHGTLRLGERRAAKAVRISQSILNGTGQALGSQVGGILGICLNQTRTLRTPEGEEVALTHPGTALKGPYLGSVRKPVLRREGREGDFLTMVVDLNDDTLELRVTRREELRRNWETVGRLTGLGEEACAVTMAEALICREWETRRLLESRGDWWVAEAMPPGWGEVLEEAAKEDDEGEEAAGASEPSTEEWTKQQWRP